MDYLEQLKGIFVAEAEQRLYSLIPNDHVMPPITEGTFEPNTCYLRVWLNDMYLAHKRFLYQTRSPVVHATCRFNYESTAQDLRLVVGPGQNENLRGATDHMVNLNYNLLGPVPYIGGDVELLIALVAMEATDYGNKFLDVLGMLSQLTSRGELKVAIPFLQPLKSGVEGLFGLQELQVHLGVHDTFSYGVCTPNRLTSGYRVVMDVSNTQIDISTLWVKDGRLYSGPNIQSAKPFKGADYFLFYLEKLDKRGDDIPSVRKAWDSAVEAARSSDQKNDQKVDRAINAFMSIVLTSPDLTQSDQKERILALIEWIKGINSMKNQYGFVQTIFDTSLGGALEEMQGPASNLSAQARSLSLDEIMNLSWR